MNVVAIRRGPGRYGPATNDVVMDSMIHDIGVILNWIGSTPEIVTANGNAGRYSSIDLARTVLSFGDGSTAVLIAERDREPYRRIRVVQGVRRYHIDCLAKTLNRRSAGVSVQKGDALQAQITANAGGAAVKCFR